MKDQNGAIRFRGQVAFVTAQFGLANTSIDTRAFRLDKPAFVAKSETTTAQVVSMPSAKATR